MSAYISDYESVLASQTDQICGPHGAKGDILMRVIIIPTSVSPGVVAIQDGDGTAVVIFDGGTDSLTELKPTTVEIGALCRNPTTPGWKITTGANVRVLAIGAFS